MTTLITVALSLVVFGLIAYQYEKRIKRIHEAHTQTIVHNVKLIASSEKILSGYTVLFSVLKDNFTEDEIQQMYEAKRKELEKLKGEQQL